jgi:hypothetical protein
MQTVARSRVGARPPPPRRIPSVLALALLMSPALLRCAGLDERVPGLAESGSELLPDEAASGSGGSAGRDGAGAAGSEGRPDLGNGGTPSITPTACAAESGKPGCGPPAPRPATCSEPDGCREVCVVGTSRVGACAIGR